MWTLKMKETRLKMKPCRVYRPEVNDSHRFDEDPDQHLRKKVGSGYALQ